MASSKPVRFAACILCLLFLTLPSSSSSESLIDHSLVVGENATLQVSNGVAVRNSPGAKPGNLVTCGRVHVFGLSRLKNLERFADTVRVKIEINSSYRVRPFEVCFHRWSMRLTVLEAAVVVVAVVAAAEVWRGVMVVGGSGGQLCRALQSLVLEHMVHEHSAHHSHHSPRSSVSEIPSFLSFSRE